MFSTRCQCYHGLYCTPSSIRMNAPEKSQKKTCKDCKYSNEELEQILPFKNIFIEADTVSQQILILQNKITSDVQLLAKVCIMSHDLDYDKKYFLQSRCWLCGVQITGK